MKFRPEFSASKHSSSGYLHIMLIAAGKVRKLSLSLWPTHISKSKIPPLPLRGTHNYKEIEEDEIKWHNHMSHVIFYTIQ